MVRDRTLQLGWLSPNWIMVVTSQNGNFYQNRPVGFIGLVNELRIRRKHTLTNSN